MNKLLAFSACVLFSAALVAPAFAEQPSVPAGPLKMELTKKPVIFDHAQHKDFKCDACHHQVNGKENFQKCATAGCHDALGQKDKTVHSYYRIAHDRKVEGVNSCLKCHFEQVQQQEQMSPEKKKALTSCMGSACHPKS